MKSLKYFTLLLGAIALVACDYESFEDESGLELLEEGIPFVRLTNSIEDNALDATLSEADTTTSVTLINPNNNGVDYTVNYTLGGSATFGEIYTVEGATASGGSIALPFDNGTDGTGFSEADIEFEFLVDTLASGSQTIELTLTDATASDGSPVNVGQGGLFQNVTITLMND